MREFLAKNQVLNLASNRMLVAAFQKRLYPACAEALLTYSGKEFNLTADAV